METEAGSENRGKQAAAVRACELVEDGMVLGLGTGSTAALFIAELAKRVADGLRVVCVPTSNRSAQMAQAAGMSLSDLDHHPHLDLDIDGADEIDPALNLLKGAGGALLHEKIIALASASFVVIADESKLVKHLGSRAVPVEVVAFGWRATQARIDELGATSVARGSAVQPAITESGNIILDVTPPNQAAVLQFGEILKSVTGVVDHGIFQGVVDRALVGCDDGSIRELTPRMT